MPQIVSLLPAAPAVPTAAPALAPAASPVAPGALLPQDPTSPNFLAQFKAALKTIANVVVQPQLTPRPATDPNAAPLMSPVTDEPSTPPAAADAKKHADVNMPDLLAELGFAIVPLAFPTLVPTPQPVAPAAASAPTAPERVASPLVPQSAAPRSSPPQAKLGPVMTQGAVVQTRRHAAPLVQAMAAAPVSQPLPTTPLVQPLPDAKPGQALADLQLGQPLPDVLGQALPQLQLQTAPTSAPVTHQPIAHLKPADQPQSPTLPPALATAPDLSAAAAVMLPTTPPAVPAAPAPQIGVVQPASQDGASQSDTAGGDQRRPAPDKVASIPAEVTPVQYVPTSDAAMVAAAATTVNAAPLPVPVSPSQVVSQIARHADVMRLPGNRGLHIQLHPDDLGGVQVTVRYTPGGGVELHINAEHAATGALVQAGWTELRDALASQGISADRLMMSVTTPTGAGQSDLSGGGGNRSDPNSASSSQASLSSQSQGQSRQDNTQQRTSQTRSGGLEPVASTDENPRVASASPGASRIDYRV